MLRLKSNHQFSLIQTSIPKRKRGLPQQEWKDRNGGEGQKKDKNLGKKKNIRL